MTNFEQSEVPFDVPITLTGAEAPLLSADESGLPRVDFLPAGSAEAPDAAGLGTVDGPGVPPAEPPETGLGGEQPDDDPFGLRRFDHMVADETDTLLAGPLHYSLLAAIFEVHPDYIERNTATEQITLACEQPREDFSGPAADTLLITADRTRGTIAARIEGSDITHTYYPDTVGALRVTTGDTPDSRANANTDRYALFEEIDIMRHLAWDARPPTVPFTKVASQALELFVNPLPASSDEPRHAAKEFRDFVMNRPDLPATHHGYDVRQGNILTVSVSAEADRFLPVIQRPYIRASYEKTTISKDIGALPELQGSILETLAQATETVTLEMQIHDGQLYCTYRRYVATPDGERPIVDTGNLRLIADRRLFYALRNAVRKPRPA